MSGASNGGTEQQHNGGCERENRLRENIGALPRCVCDDYWPGYECPRCDHWNRWRDVSDGVPERCVRCAALVPVEVVEAFSDL